MAHRYQPPYLASFAHLFANRFANAFTDFIPSKQDALVLWSVFDELRCFRNRFSPTYLGFSKVLDRSIQGVICVEGYGFNMKRRLTYSNITGASGFFYLQY